MRPGAVQKALRCQQHHTRFDRYGMLEFALGEIGATDVCRCPLSEARAPDALQGYYASDGHWGTWSSGQEGDWHGNCIDNAVVA